MSNYPEQPKVGASLSKQTTPLTSASTKSESSNIPDDAHGTYGTQPHASLAPPETQVPAKRVQIRGDMLVAVATLVAAAATLVAALISVYIVPQQNELIRQRSNLEITALSYNFDKSELDVKVRNKSQIDALITKLTLYIVHGTEICALPVLPPSAGYDLPAGFRTGHESSVEVSHRVEANKPDRFLVALHNTCISTARFTIFYNADQSVNQEIELSP